MEANREIFDRYLTRSSVDRGDGLLQVDGRIYMGRLLYIRVLPPASAAILEPQR